MKEITIQIPDNYELIKDGDTYIVKEKKRTPPRSWEEFCKNYPLTGEYFIDTYSNIKNTVYKADVNVNRNIKYERNLINSKEEAEAFLALMQLRQLRKAWIGNWNYEISSQNYIPSIVCVKESGIIITESIHNHVLSFPTKEMAENFLSCFKDLCETAKILL